VSTHIKEKKEKIEQILTKLTEDSAKGKLIVVEGAKDAQTLRMLGVNGRILQIKTGGKSFLEATTEIEKLKPQVVILLLDFDRRGKEGTKRLKQDLERAKVKVDMSFWRGLQALVGREVQCVESLNVYLDTLNSKVS